MKKAIAVTIILILVVILGGLAFYFTQINNLFASKENLEKPEVDTNLLLQNPGTQVIFEDHVEYLANEMGAYKVHSSNDEDAVIVFRMTDINKEIAYISGDKKYVSTEIPIKYDLVVKTDQLTAAQLIESSDIVTELKNKINEGKITVDVISDTTTLAMKGYLSVYEELTS